MVAVGPGRRKGADGELIPMGTCTSLSQLLQVLPVLTASTFLRFVGTHRCRPRFAFTQQRHVTATGVKVGDTVLLPDYGGQGVVMGQKEKETFLYSDQEILGIIESI